MTYTIAEITELIHYHLVLGESDDASADRNLAQLAGAVQDLATRPLWHEVTWVFCDYCGTSVDTDLIHPDGHHYSDEGDFYCADCWGFGEES
jgi:hypothetical protein